MCTTFVLKNKNTALLGKSYDFYYGHGLVLVNKRNLVKRSLLSKTEHKVAEWTSKYGSVTFNQFGRELPQCGINEAGFAVAQMNLLDVRIAEPHKEAVNELQWMQYQLDNYSSVKEAVEHAKDLSIELAYLPLHYTICDAQGNSAIIEFIGDEVGVYENPAITVLTNNTFEESLNYCQKFDGKSLPKSMYPLDRFVRTYYSVKRFDEQATKDPMAYAFSTLDSVRSTLGFGSLFNYLLRHIPPGASYWNMVFDCKNKVVYFRTLNQQPRRKRTGYDGMHGLSARA